MSQVVCGRRFGSTTDVLGFVVVVVVVVVAVVVVVVVVVAVFVVVSCACALTPCLVVCLCAGL